MKILLFGKNGQVGSALAPVLAARGEVIALGRDSLGGLSGDLSEPRRIVESRTAWSVDRIGAADHTILVILTWRPT